VDFVKGILNKSNDYEGLKVLVTAGPTREPIDPVRYISNHSSGRWICGCKSRLGERGLCEACDRPCKHCSASGGGGCLCDHRRGDAQ